jgi:hypothetical protein
LEVGAVPILVRPSDGEKNFLNRKIFIFVSLHFMLLRGKKDMLWSNYPGPVLSSWQLLDDFIKRYQQTENFNIYNLIFAAIIDRVTILLMISTNGIKI